MKYLKINSTGYSIEARDESAKQLSDTLSFVILCVTGVYIYKQLST